MAVKPSSRFRNLGDSDLNACTLELTSVSPPAAAGDSNMPMNLGEILASRLRYVIRALTWYKVAEVLGTDLCATEPGFDLSKSDGLEGPWEAINIEQSPSGANQRTPCDRK